MHSTEHKRDVILGVVFVLLSLAFVLFLNDLAIEIPTASHKGQASSPRSFPDMIFWAMLAFSLGLLWSSFRKMRAAPAAAPDSSERTPFDWTALSFRMAAMATLVLLFAVADRLGILIGGLIFYLLFAFFSGERNVLRALAGASLTTAILYYLFVKVAGVPLPMGVLENII